MSLLVVCVVILAVLTLLNMSLSAAIVRTMRAGRGAPADLPKAGDTVAPYSVPALDGGSIDGPPLGDTLAVFVTPTCGPCATLLETWPERVAELPEDIVAFVINTSSEEEAAAYAAKLGPRVRTAVVGRDSDVARAFGVGDVTPTLVRLRDDVVEKVGHSVDRVLGGRERVAR